MNYFSIDGTTNEWFVLFHGTGGNEYSLLQIAGDIQPTASILSFIGDVGEGANRRFFAPLANGVLQREDFNERVDAFLEQWSHIAPTTGKVTFIGYSNGANFILGLLEKQPHIAHTVVLMHPSNLQYTFEQGSDASLIITAGAMDALSIPGETMKLAKQLEQAFAHTTFKLFDGAHNVTNTEIDYLQQHLQTTK